MRLLEAIIDANHRALAGDRNAGVHTAEFEAELPLVALTCIDVRLNPLLPQVLGVLPEHFIWLRNAGNIITGPLSSTMRSMALACAVKGGKEIVIIGHTDCQVAKTTTSQLLDRLRALGVERHLLPDNLNEFFGVFASERQNVIKAATIARSSPLIGPKVPVHGLVLDIRSGRLDWLVNGYEILQTIAPVTGAIASVVARGEELFKPLAGFKLEEMKFPETKIGEIASKVEQWITPKPATPEPKPTPPATPPKLPLPPRIGPRMKMGKRP
ncbi:MAG: hypothetical protein C5B50_29700 [Verrucomicrobia bacterium]|nr:MAG: hypothetical protein C5B50_29700 [Verrucomicrobiota bacterium]